MNKETLESILKTIIAACEAGIYGLNHNDNVIEGSEYILKILQTMLIDFKKQLKDYQRR